MKMRIKKLFFAISMAIIILASNLSCFAADAKYPVKTDTIKQEINFAQSSEPQVINFKTGSDVANKLTISVVDTRFETQNGKTIFTEANKNTELDKYLSFTYMSVIDVIPGGELTDVQITVIPNDLPEGVYYKGIKVSHVTETAISSILVPVVINNQVAGKVYDTAAEIDYVGIEGDYILKTPFEICIGMTNTGETVINSINGELYIKDDAGEVKQKVPFVEHFTFFPGAPREVRVPVTANLEDGVYTAEAVVIYDSLKPEISGQGSFEVRQNLANAVGKDVKPIVVKTTLPTWAIAIIIAVAVLMLIILLMLLLMLKKKNKKNEQ